VALCYPYGQPELRKLVAETDGPGGWKLDAIGLSEGDRPLLRLANDYGEAEDEKSRRPGIYLTARQHAGETPGSWVLDGVLRRFAAMGEDAPRVWCVPLVDIDGVEEGDYGKDAPPHDFNRAWTKRAMRHEVHTIAADARRWARRCEPALFVDFHGPGICTKTGIYTYLRPDAEHPDAAAASRKLAETIREHVADLSTDESFARETTHGGRYRPQTATAHFLRSFDIAALTVECSYIGCGETVFTPEHYREAGSRIAAAMAAFIRSRSIS
jgi:predicted deacylase